MRKPPLKIENAIRRAIDAYWQSRQVKDKARQDFWHDTFNSSLDDIAEIFAATQKRVCNAAIRTALKEVEESYFYLREAANAANKADAIAQHGKRIQKLCKLVEEQAVKA